MEKNQIRKSLIYALLFGMIYIFIPWNILLGREFNDAQVYLNTINLILVGKYEVYYPVMGTFLDWIKFILSEPLWKVILTFISENFYDPSNGLLLISLFSICVFSVYVFKRMNIFLGSFLLLNPIMIDFIMSQIRSSLALSLIVFSTFSKRNIVIVSCFLAGFLIHSASFILIPILLMSQRISTWDLTQKAHKLFVCLMIIILALLLSYILSFQRESLLITVDRRAVYTATSANLRYVMFWFFISASLILIPSCDKNRIQYSDFFSATLASMAFFMSLFSVYSARFLAFMYPFLIFSLTFKSLKYRIFYYFSLIVYQLALYYYWFQI